MWSLFKNFFLTQISVKVTVFPLLFHNLTFEFPVHINYILFALNMWSLSSCVPPLWIFISSWNNPKRYFLPNVLCLLPSPTPRCEQTGLPVQGLRIWYLLLWPVVLGLHWPLLRFFGSSRAMSVGVQVPYGYQGVWLKLTSCKACALLLYFLF